LDGGAATVSVFLQPANRTAFSNSASRFVSFTQSACRMRRNFSTKGRGRPFQIKNRKQPAFFAAIHRQKTASHRQPGRLTPAIVKPDEKFIPLACVNPPMRVG